jgi:hypothetical protein
MAARKKRTIPYRNRSPHGWWIATYLLRLQYSDEDIANPNRRCLAWENTIILQAPNRESAYAKACRLGRYDSNGSEVTELETGRKGTWVFEGLKSLLPIYEQLQDGAEVLWREHSGVAARTIKSWVREKAALEVFNDEDK